MVLFFDEFFGELQGLRFKQLNGNSKQKLSFYKERYANSTILYRPVKGFSHSFIDLQCSSQGAPLRESCKRSTDGPQQKRTRAIMALSFFNSWGLKQLCYFNYNKFPIKQNF